MKCVPELARFESKIIDFNLEIDKNSLIIRRFDENLANKAEKTTIEQLYNHLNITYASKQEQEKFLGTAKSQQDQIAKQLKQNKELITKGVDQINKKVNQEIQKSFLQLKGSYLDESHSGIDILNSNIGGEKQS